MLREVNTSSCAHASESLAANPAQSGPKFVDVSSVPLGFRESGTGHLSYWKSEPKGRALARLRIGANPSAPALNNPLTGGKADSRTRVFTRAVQPLEGCEQHAGLFGRK